MPEQRKRSISDVIENIGYGPAQIVTCSLVFVLIVVHVSGTTVFVVAFVFWLYSWDAMFVSADVVVVACGSDCRWCSWW